MITEFVSEDIGDELLVDSDNPEHNKVWTFHEAVSASSSFPGAFKSTRIRL